MYTYRKTNVTISDFAPQKSVKLWWPNEYGDQPLYNLNVAFFSGGTSETSSKSVRIGFRTVQLVEEPMSKYNTIYKTILYVFSSYLYFA